MPAPRATGISRNRSYPKRPRNILIGLAVAAALAAGGYTVAALAEGGPGYGQGYGPGMMDGYGPGYGPMQGYGPGYRHMRGYGPGNTQDQGNEQRQGYGPGLPHARLGRQLRPRHDAGKRLRPGLRTQNDGLVARGATAL